MFLQRTKEWTNGKHFIASTISVGLIIHADLLFSILQDKTTWKFGSQLPDFNIQSWLKLYRKHFTLKKAVKKKNDSFLKARSINFADAVMPILMPQFEQQRRDRELSKNNPQDFDKFRESFEKAVIATYLNNFEYDPKRLTLNDIVETFKELPVTLFDSFDLKVLIPVWLLYQTPACLLFFKARHGDIKSLDQLLRFDKLAIFDPLIAKIWQYESRYPKKQRFKVISNALAGLPREKITRKRFKIFLAAVIAKCFSDFQKPISYMEIRNLFDAFAADTINSPIDPDLPESEEAFTVAVKREIKGWEKGF